ncbi:MAG: acyl-CoA dehydrogenase family protein [Gemmatimonadales bacterium]|nr:acyl-CoA dehydrogenase family protein [Gemmatimonadales bacterium]
MQRNPYLTDAHEAHREEVASFTREFIVPVAGELDRTQAYPWENVKRMAERGWLGIMWPREAGGGGLDEMHYYVTLHEVAKACAGHAVIISVQTNLGTTSLHHFGTDWQKETWFAKLASGRILAAFGLTEEEAGSDAGGTQTTAVDRGDHYVLNGRKIFITHGGVAEFVIATARTEAGPRGQGITSFILAKDTIDPDACRRVGIGHDPSIPRTKGFRVGRTWEKMGWRAVNWGELLFEDAIVPKEQVLGEPGRGYANFLRLLDGGRIGIAAVSLGIAEGAYEAARQRAKDRRQFGRPIGSYQGVSFKLADLAMEIQAGQHLLYHAAWLKANGHPYKLEASMAKLFCSELAMRATTQAVQVFGGLGYTREAPVEKMMRDAKVCEIGEGTSEIQRMLIARQILGGLASD